MSWERRQRGEGAASMRRERGVVAAWEGRQHGTGAVTGPVLSVRRHRALATVADCDISRCLP